MHFYFFGINRGLGSFMKETKKMLVLRLQQLRSAGLSGPGDDGGVDDAVLILVLVLRSLPPAPPAQGGVVN